MRNQAHASVKNANHENYVNYASQAKNAYKVTQVYLRWAKCA